MKIFLTYSSIAEAFMGILFILFPSWVVLLLFGSSLSGKAGMIFSMMAGVTIFVMALICWLLRNDSNRIIAVKTLLFYNILFTAVLIYGAVHGLTGPVLWPIIGFHAFQIIMGLIVF